MKATEQYFAVIRAVCYAVQGGYIFWLIGWNPNVLPFKWGYQTVLSLYKACTMPYNVVLNLSLWMKS